MKYLLLLVFVVFSVGCGGGGSSSPTSVPEFKPIAQIVVESFEFEQGENFYPSADFKNRCEMPRTGINPRTGQAFGDIQGSIETENKWLRSWSHELYLWYDEIIDRDPALYSDPLEYFDTLKTIATTPSGNQRDQFHFTYDTEEWRQLSQSGVGSGYGAYFFFKVLDDPLLALSVKVGFVEPGSPAELGGLVRGDEITMVDGVDLSNLSDGSGSAFDTNFNRVFEGLFPSNVGDEHHFDIVSFSGPSQVSLTAASFTSSPVLHTDVVSTPTGDVGYLLFNDHIATAEAQLIASINQLKGAGVSDLVLDLRYNGGGLLSIASELAYMIAGPAFTSDKTFELLAFNDKHSVVNPVTSELIEPIPFYDVSQGYSVASGQSLPTLDLSRVYILTGEDTCSASESIINSLRGINVEVIQVGTTTCGKPYGFYPQDNCGTTYFSIQFSGINDIGFSDYSDGFSPQNTIGERGAIVTGCSVADDFSKELGDPLEAMLESALQYRVINSCPLPPPPISFRLKKPALSNSLPMTKSEQLSQEIVSWQGRAHVQNKIF